MELLAQHKLLSARAGFGISLNDFKTQVSIKEKIDSLFPSAIPAPFNVVTNEDIVEYKAAKQKDDAESKQLMQKAIREKVQELNLMWLQEMAKTSYPLLEKISLFWHGHFATQISNPYFDQLLLNDIRTNALGNFGDMLKIVSKSPSMLQFLNNQQNRKQHPNENFAREVMELFTLGRGNYTENDVKEAARAFTGWGFNQQGEFVFRNNQHDDGEKQFLGKTGNFTGDDILNILLEQKQTAVHITKKIYRFFVSDITSDEERIQQLAADFYNNQYDITLLLKQIFTADWFYNDKIVGAKIKSPVELLVNYQRTIPLQFKNDKTQLLLQRTLGQVLFYPPNVAGWPGGTNWIDSSSLIIRMSLPEALFGSKELNLSAKEVDPEMNESDKENYMREMQPQQHFKVGVVTPDWTSFTDFWKQYKQEELPQQMANYLLNVPVNDNILKEVNNFADKDTPDEYIKSLMILFMKLPEYQLT
jgi:uncharacterized protein (DUF1800 family)